MAAIPNQSSRIFERPLLHNRIYVFLCRLKTGWSVKTRQMQSFGGRQDSTLNESEQAIIKEVIKRAEMLEVTEQERVG